MNKIFKVIYSKVRNCYVVTSEFAKANTKSSTGSAKSKTGRKALLTLSAVCAIFCGGLVNVGVVDTVHVDESTTLSTAQEVYTKTAVDNTFAKKSDLESKASQADVNTNKANIGTLQTSVGTNTTDIGKLKTDMAKKADQTAVEALQTAVGNTYTKTEADDKFATKESLTSAKTELEGKIGSNTTRITALETKATTTETTLNDHPGRLLLLNLTLINYRLA